MKPKQPPDESIRVLGMDYKIMTGVPAVGEEDFCGKVAFYERTIRLRMGLDNVHKTSALIHEVIEIINDSLELELKHPQIMALERGIFQSITENPLLLGMLNTVALEDK